MKLRTKKVELTDKDKQVLLKYLNVCTDLGGYGCGIMKTKEASFNLSMGLN
ncbi:MAG: hypothetical protein BWY74_00697 [Firmicutes bacterium ADurb.Bin419]|nr:MAG: hypothetical protein BWY74_00697 [Firmicutes bacterium ADurb.Bin419]